MQLNKRVVILFLFFTFIFTLVLFAGIPTFSQAAGYEYINGYQEWTADRTLSNIIVINPGATLVIKNGITLTFAAGSGINVYGSLYVKGTTKNGIVFKKDENASNYLIKIQSEGRLIMKNTDVSGAGQGVWLGNAQAGISVYGGWLDVDGSSFYDNNIPIYISNQNPSRIRVNRTKFFNNSNYDVYYKGTSGSLINFEYNWWGSPDGPPKVYYAPGKWYYEKFEKAIDASNWLTQESFKDPVIIIPGILGSWEKNGTLQIDPIFHTYDNLYAELANNGYTPEENLFIFPYEWRDSNVKNAQKLKLKIDSIKQQLNWPDVDIVAHSMGGLLAREYIESGYYGNDVDQLITLATPNLGAPEAYIKWDGDGWLLSPSDIYIHHIIKQEAEESEFSDVFDYLHNRPITSLKELLPVYSYLYDAENGNALRAYPGNYPRNEFLEILNNKSGKLNLVEYDKIIGNLDDSTATIGGYNVVNVDMGKYWIHGYPLGFEIPATDRGMIRLNGDGTVPLDSARSVDIKSDNSIELQSDHQSIVTDAQKDVLELLTSIRPTTEVRHSLIKDILITQVFSPVDIQIIDPDGKWAGKNIQGLNESEQIADAYYTGSDATSEFVTIPNPKNGQYKIWTQGTGDGNYRIEATKIAEDLNDPQKATESTGVIEGVAVIGKQEKTTIEINDYKVITKDMTPPIVTINYPKENEEYLNNQILNVGYESEDNKTASENILIDIYLDDAKLNNKNIDLSLQKLGNHKIKIVATDETKNIGFAEVDFKTIANINTISDNVIRYQDLGYIFELKTADFLQVKIKDISHTLDMIAKMSEKNNTNPPENKTKLLDKQIDDLINFIQEKFAGTIREPVGDLLIESLKSLKK